MQTLILRVSNVYGFPETDGPPQGVISRLIHAALENQTFHRWGADTEKDYLHIEDLATALSAAWEKQLTGVYNLAQGQTFRLSELIKLIETKTNRETPINVTVNAEHVSWDVERNRVNPSKFIEDADWLPNAQESTVIDMTGEELTVLRSGKGNLATII